MGSGLIYAVIVVLWAAVLIPMWLRRHDAETESRSVDRFSAAMRILSRRPARASRSSVEAQEVVVPPSVEPAEPIAYVKPTVRPVTAPAPALPPEPAPSVDLSPRRAPRSAAPPAPGSAAVRRRRRILLGLAALLVAAGIGYAVGVVGLWAPLVAAVLAVGFLVLSSVTSAAARRAHDAQVRELARRQRRAAWQDGHDTVVLPRPAAGRAAAAPESVEVDDRGWTPTSIPVPTYVTAPPASPIPREIDRSGDRPWDAQRMLEEAARVRAEAEAEDARAMSAPDRDSVFDREWFEAIDDDTAAQLLAEEDERRFGAPRRRAVGD